MYQLHHMPSRHLQSPSFSHPQQMGHLFGRLSLFALQWKRLIREMTNLETRVKQEGSIDVMSSRVFLQPGMGKSELHHHLGPTAVEGSGR